MLQQIPIKDIFHHSKVEITLCTKWTFINKYLGEVDPNMLQKCHMDRKNWFKFSLDLSELHYKLNDPLEIKSWAKGTQLCTSGNYFLCQVDRHKWIFDQRDPDMFEKCNSSRKNWFIFSLDLLSKTTFINSNLCLVIHLKMKI